jgi:hypothetical protein
MNKPPKDLDLCYQCGWLGMCTVACPLLDPAQQIPVSVSTAPDLDPALDDLSFEIVHDTSPDETFPPDRRA